MTHSLPLSLTQSHVHSGAPRRNYEKIFNYWLTLYHSLTHSLCYTYNMHPVPVASRPGLCDQAGKIFMKIFTYVPCNHFNQRTSAEVGSVCRRFSQSLPLGGVSKSWFTWSTHSIFFDAADGALFADKRMIMLSIRRQFLPLSGKRKRRRKTASLVHHIFFDVVCNRVGFFCRHWKGRKGVGGWGGKKEIL